MKTSQRWLWLLLVASAQLIALLVTIIVLFFWQLGETDRVLDENSCNNTSRVLRQLDAMIAELRVLDIRSQPATDLDKMESAIEKSLLGSDSYIGLFDRANLQLIRTLSSPELLEDPDALMSLRIQSTDGNLSGELGQLVSNDRRTVSGWQYHDDSKTIVAAQFMPRLNAILVVAQNSDQTPNRIARLIHLAQSKAFAMTLMIGLLGICITAVIVRRVTETVDTLNDGLERVVSSSTSELIRTKNAVIFGLAKLAESRDNDTGEHLERIRIYVTILAKELALTCSDFDERFIHDLGLASSLHDIGKVGIPDSILLKPGRLTPEERGIMEIHTLIGGECLDAIQARLGDNEFMNIARQIAYYHHERWDGTGYPHSLKGREIPLVARIVAVADVYDALTSKRPYKRAMSHAESKEIIVEGSGKQFDPEIVEVFLRHERDFEAVSIHQQTLTDEQATSNFQRLCEAARNSGEQKPEFAMAGF